MAKSFSLIGVAGYIAVRHVNAIKETGNNLVAALDKFDSVGFLDSYFPEADFFTEYERFDRHTFKLQRKGNKIDFVSICSPNYLHDSHIRFALKNDSDAICEKPLVLNPWNIDALEELEKETGHQVNTILQLRLHPSIIALKKQIDEGSENKIYDIDLTYITSRGNWYHFSWKGDNDKSGGIATNIGIHFFDMLTWIFGSVKNNILHISTNDRASGFLQLEKARVRWFLSLNQNDLPKNIKEKKQRTYRSIAIEGQEIEFSDGFTDLHTLSYRSILENKGFKLKDARLSVETSFNIRNSELHPLLGDFHSYCLNIK
jgi:UDP-N-acetyl-2-amino-2-deoxyglucuronate dehydrogenase